MDPDDSPPARRGPRVRRVAPVSRRVVLRVALTGAAAGVAAVLAACADDPPAGGPVVVRPTPVATPPDTSAEQSGLPDVGGTPPAGAPTGRAARAGVFTPRPQRSAPPPELTSASAPTPSDTPVPTSTPTRTPAPTPAQRPTPRQVAASEPLPTQRPGALELDGAQIDERFLEERLWEHWDAAQAYFARNLDEQAASEFHSAVAVAFAQGRTDVGEYLAAETLQLVERDGGAARLAALDLGGRTVGWLPPEPREALRRTANDVYRSVMTHERNEITTGLAIELLAQLRVIRSSSGLFGLHWPDPSRRYRDGTPFVERVVSFAADNTEYQRERVRTRVAKLRDRHPNSPIIVRVDFRPGQVIPRNEAERTEYYRQLENIISAPEFQGLIMQQGNEPQFEGNPTPDEIAREFNGWGVAETDTGNFWTRCDIFNPTAIRLPMPIAPFHPAGPETANPAGLEDSPWARLAYQSKRRILDGGRARGRVPQAWSEHVYGDPRPGGAGAEREAWTDVRDPLEGFRWGMNVGHTWQEINTHVEREFGLPPLPVWITEFNTAARGITPPFQPADNYVRDWMIHALAQMSAALPTLTGACWFVADSYNHDAQWTRFALHEGHGRLPDAEKDLEALQAAGV